MEKVNSRTCALMIRDLYATDRMPLHVWGPPGTGKSATVAQVAKEDGLQFIDLRLVQLDALDLRGMPKVVEKYDELEMIFVTPGMLPRSGAGILFLDEFCQAPMIVQNAASQLVLDRKLGDYRLPDDWHIVAASNSLKDRAGVNPMATHLKNRFVHAEMGVDHKNWLSFATKAGYHPLVTSFIKARPEALYKFDPDGFAFPTLRTWEYVSKIMHKRGDSKGLKALVNGSVGTAVGNEFMQWINSAKSIPTYDEVVGSPSTVDLPSSGQVGTLQINSIVSSMKGEHIPQILTWLDRLRTKSPDLGSYAVASLLATPFDANEDVVKWISSVLGS